MIQAKIVMDSGAVFRLGTSYGSLFDIDPLTELDIDISSQQGFQTAGVTVTGQSVGGISRRISGSFISADARSKARKLCRTLLPLSTGTFYLGEEVCAEFYVEKTPELDYRSHDIIDFDFMLFSANPYWQAATETVGETSVYIQNFRFYSAAEQEAAREAGITLDPTYDSHSYGKLSEGCCILQHDGDMDSTYELTLTARKDCSSFGIINPDTLEKLELDTELVAGDVVAVKWSAGALTILKNGTENIFSALTEDSDFFAIHPGVSKIWSYAAEGSGLVSARIKFRAAYASYVEV